MKFIEEFLDHGWWYLGNCSKTSTMADGSPRVQIDAGEQMIDTEGYNNFAKSQKNRQRLVMLIIPLESEFAEDLVKELMANNDKKTG